MSGDDDSGGPVAVNFSGETLKAVVAKFTMALSGFVGTIVFARALGPYGFGGFYLLLSVVQMTDRPFRGLMRAIKKRFAEDDTDDDQIVGALVLAAITWSVLVLVVGWLFQDWLTSYTGIEDALFPFSVLAVGLLGNTPFTLLQARGHLGASEWADALRSYLTFPLQLAFVLLGFGAAGMAYGLSVATVLVVPVAVYYLHVKPSLPSRETLASLWGFARYSIPTAFVGRAYNRFDVLVLGFILTPAAVANYQVAAKLTLPATFVASSASTLLMPRVSQTDSRGESVAADISNTLAFGSVLSIPIFFGTVAIPEALIVTVFGSEYAGAGTMLIAIALYRFIDTQSEPLLQSLDGIDRPRTSFRLSTVALIVNIPLGLYLVTQVGAYGVVVATIVAESIRYVGAAYVLSTEVDGLLLYSISQAKQLGAGIGMFVVVEFLSHAVGITSWLDLGVVVGVGGAVYGLTLLAISHELRTTIASVFEGTRYDVIIRRLLDLFDFND